MDANTVIRTYKYVRLLFQASLSWNTHFFYQVDVVQHSSTVVLRFFHSKQAYFIHASHTIVDFIQQVTSWILFLCSLSQRSPSFVVLWPGLGNRGELTCVSSGLMCACMQLDLCKFRCVCVCVHMRQPHRSCSPVPNRPVILSLCSLVPGQGWEERGSGLLNCFVFCRFVKHFLHLFIH